jgi:predicted nucleic acid-binding protein
VPVVLDASIVLSWYFDDEVDEYGARVLRSLGGDTAVEPAIWPLEIANGVLMAERRGRLSLADATRVLNTVAQLPVTLDAPEFGATFGRVLTLAREQTLSAYDASYLELALRSSLPLATHDRRLREAAMQIGLKLVQ